MLRSVQDMLGYRIHAVDEDIGSVENFYFDDEAWVIRYLIVDTGNWLPGRRVLISPEAIVKVGELDRGVFLSVTKERVEGAPSIREDLPVSRQEEARLAHYYGWTAYWAPGMPPAGAVPPPPEGVLAEEREADRHLRSVREVSGYHVKATDGEIGHTEDFIAETESWIIRYLAIDTRNWLPGKKVLIAPDWFGDIDWAGRSVNAVLSREQIRNAPEYNPNEPVNRRYEAMLYDYYGRPVYWE